MNAFVRHFSNREVRFLFCALLCRLWLDRHRLNTENEEDVDEGVEVRDGYEPFVRLFGESRWQKSVNALFDIRWEPFEICDVSVVRHVFVAHWHGGWPPIDLLGEAGRFEIDPELIQVLDQSRTEEEFEEMMSREWGFAPLYTRFTLETMRWSIENPRPFEQASVPMPRTMPELKAFWQAAQRWSGHRIVRHLTKKVTRCVVCGHATVVPDASTTSNRYRCPHCDAPYEMKKKKTSAKRQDKESP